MSDKTSSHNVLSLFSGCGGMDLGLEGDFDVLFPCVNHKIHPDWILGESKPGWVRLRPRGFKTVFANDISRAARAAWVPYFIKRGVSPSAFHLASIVDLVKSAESGEPVFPKTVDVVTGGFPCQDFSVAGKRKGILSHKNHLGLTLSDIDDPTIENRGMLYMWMRRTIELTQPNVFIAENVKGLVNLADTKTVIENDFRNLSSGSYLVISARVLNAAEYGVPQKRERIFFFGFRKSALKPTVIKPLESQHINQHINPYPLPTHAWPNKPNSLDAAHNNLLPAVTVGQIIGDLGEPQDDTTDLSHAGFSKAQWYGTHCQGQIEMDMHGLGPTIRAEHHGNIEFRRLSYSHGGKIQDELDRGLTERRLSVRECARLQTFPDDFEFVRGASKDHPDFSLSVSAGYRLVGNAVPPILAYHIGSRLAQLWPIIFKGG